MWEKLRNIIVDKLEEAGFLKRARKEELRNAGILGRKNTLIVFSLFFIVLSIGLTIFSIVKYEPWLGLKVYENAGGVMGRSVWGFLVSYFIWRFVFKRKRGTGLLCFSILLLLISSYNLYEVKEDKILVSVDIFQKEIGSMGKDILDNKAIQSRDYDSKSYGEWAPVLQVINEGASQLQADFLGLAKEMKEQQIETMLTQHTLEDINRIRKAQERLQKAGESLDRYEIIIRQRYRELDTKLSNLNIPNMKKEAFLRGYNSKKTREPKLSQSFLG